MLQLVPSHCRHTAIAFPAASAATWGRPASVGSDVTGTATSQPDPGTYRLACTVQREPSHCLHAAMKFPEGSTVTSTFRLSPEPDSMRTAGSQPIPAM